MQLGLGFWGSKTLLSAVELGLFTELARTARSTPRRCASGSACTRAAPATSSTRWWRSACSSASDGVYANTPDDRPLPRPRQAVLRRRHARDGERAALRVLGLAHRGAAHRRAAERGQDAAATSSTALYADPDRLSEFLQGDDRAQHRGRARRSRPTFPWAGYQTLSTSAARRAACRAGRARARAPAAAAASTCPVVSPIFDELRRRVTASATGCASQPGDFFADPLPAADVLVMGHILHDWDLEEKRTLLAQGLRRAAGRRRADRLRGDHRRRAPRERLRAADEPQHADRDARRLRLHGRRLPRLDAEAGFRETRVEHLVGPDSMVVASK